MHTLLPEENIALIKLSTAKSKSKLGAHPARIKLCESCIEREYGASKPRGIARSIKPSDCDICHGELSKLPKLVEEINEKLREFEFETFQVGTAVPQRFLDKEDELRSAFKIRGRENLKTQITRSIGSRISKKLQKNIDYARPELTILVSLNDHSITISPKSIWLEGSYLKNERGVAQKGRLCAVCGGLGCASCEFKGFDRASIQSIIGDFLKEAYLAHDCNFIWIGSEDENSLVGGTGRPFFVEVVRPKRRGKGTAKIVGRGKTKMSIALGHGVAFRHSGVLSAKPTNIPQFKLECEVHLVRKLVEGESNDQATIDIKKIESSFSPAEIIVQVPRKFRTVSKKVDSVSVNEEGGHATLVIRCDGGIPIRKLLAAKDDSVSPNFNEFIRGYAIDDSKPFDVLAVDLIHRPRIDSRDETAADYAEHNAEFKDPDLPADSE
ncbi:MAG: tRNA pseudouridine(55) synthase [Nitrososphaerales archaeon]